MVNIFLQVKNTKRKSTLKFTVNNKVTDKKLEKTKDAMKEKEEERLCLDFRVCHGRDLSP